MTLKNVWSALCSLLDKFLVSKHCLLCFEDEDNLAVLGWSESTFYLTLPDFRKSIFFKFPRIRPFVLIRATCRWMNEYGALVECYWQGNWITGRETLYSFCGRWMKRSGSLVECYWQGKTEVQGENSLSATLSIKNILTPKFIRTIYIYIASLYTSQNILRHYWKNKTVNNM
jgi:hypothetical protein